MTDSAASGNDRTANTAPRRRCYECGKRRLVYPDLDGQQTCRRCNLRLFFKERAQ